MLSSDSMHRRLQIAGVILIAGLLVEFISLLGHGPLSFLLFAGFGGLLLFVGIGAFMLALLHTGHTEL